MQFDSKSVVAETMKTHCVSLNFTRCCVMQHKCHDHAVLNHTCCAHIAHNVLSCNTNVMIMLCSITCCSHIAKNHTRFHAVVKTCIRHLSHQLTCAFHPHGICEQCHERVKNMILSDTLCVGAHAECHMRRLCRAVCSQKQLVNRR